MSDIYEVLLKTDSGDTVYSLLDKAQKEKADALVLKVADLVNADAQQDEKISALESATSKLSESDTNTSATLADHDERITKAQNTADSNGQKYTALSAVVESNTQKIADEIERAKDVEGALDQLETTDKDSLVAAINWVLTKANKGLENVGTLADLTTSEKTDVVGAVNEIKTKVDAAVQTAKENETVVTAMDARLTAVELPAVEVYGGGTLVSSSGTRRSIGTGEIFRADSVVVKASSNKYQGITYYIKEFQVGAEINVQGTRSHNGGYWTVRVTFLGGDGKTVDGKEHTDGGTYSDPSTTGTVSAVIPDGTVKIAILLASNWSTTIDEGTEVTFSDIRAWYSEDTLTSSDTTYNTYYKGDELHLSDGSMSNHRHGCNINLWASYNITDNTDIDAYYYAYSQGLAAWGGYLFNLCESDGTHNDIQVIEMSTKQVVSAVTLDSPSHPNHKNTAFFSDIYYDDSDEFPLLFSSRCSGNGSSEDYDQCTIYRVVRDGTTFTYTYVNKITVSGSTTYGIGYAFDRNRRLLYASAPTKGNWTVTTNNPVVHWVFNMPSTSAILSGVAITLNVSCCGGDE